MEMGRPDEWCLHFISICIATTNMMGGAADLIENGKNGIIVPVGDANALAEGRCFMAEHSAEAAQMAAEAVKIRETGCQKK